MRREVLPPEALDATDRAILNALQEGFPLTPHPFADAGKPLGLSEDDLIARIQNLREEGAITRFGPFFDAEAMGGAFCLCAMAVPGDRFDAVVTLVNAHPEVAHNYERAHRLNMWFVLATDTPAGIEKTARAIEKETGLKVLRFPKLKEFFIGFRVKA
ncbi:AsnC family transcriptional regulator [Defluviimonas aestuarii]|uniref:Lrp/AsnC family transcriptional regulator n=1 Tax=Albidovulum aestuarii TaxID=1130726 RepID=UPI00249AD92E|nr:AsnC family transcriptional regulator [Defluviimonas aestuarii]MDI3337610.1 AsnC family transcriptional regulator [Defluviimonas aestuarii]